MANQSLQQLTAGDIMQRDVEVIRSNDTLRDALEMMTENHVTGLPVMDAHSKCIGLVSATDILNYERDYADEAADANADIAQHYNPDMQQWESVRMSSFALEHFGDVRVEEVMACNLVSVTKETTMTEVAQLMIRDNVHRVLVLSDDQRLFGILSATDFVRVIAEQS